MNEEEKTKKVKFIVIAIVILVSLIIIGVIIGLTIGKNETKTEEKNQIQNNYNETIEIEKQNNEVSQKEENTNKDLSSKKLVDMFKQAQEDNCTKNHFEGTCKNNSHLHIGDFVNYIPENTDASVDLLEYDTGYDATQNYKVDKEMSWRVLGLDEEKNSIILISSEPMQKTYMIKDGEKTTYYTNLIMCGAQSYINCVQTLDKVCSIYKNSNLADEVRSIKMEDIDKALGIKVIKNEQGQVTDIEVKENSLIEKNNIIYDKGNYYIYQENKYAPENYMIDKYNLMNLNKQQIENKVYSTYYGYEEINVKDSIIKDIIFKGTDLEIDNYAKSYWVASPGISTDVTYAFFSPGGVYYGNAYCGVGGLFITEGDWNALGLGVRPIVYLKSDVTQDKVNIINNPKQKDKQSWTGVEGAGNGKINGKMGQLIKVEKKTNNMQ